MWLLISGAIALGLLVITYTVSLRFRAHLKTCLHRDAAQQLRSIVEASPVPIIVTRIEDGKIVYVNDNLAEMVGYEKEELIGQLSPDFYYDRNDRSEVLDILQRDGRMRNYEVRLKKKDGSVIWTLFSLTITDIGGEKVILGGLYDFTEIKKTEGALRWERNFVSAVLDTAGALIVVLDLEGRVLRFNRACEITSGYNFMEVVGKRFSEIFIDPEELSIVEEQFRKVLESRSVVVEEYCWLTRDGSRRSISWANTVLSDEDDEPEYVIAIGIDITERNEAEEKLRLYREIYLNSRDGIVILDSDGKYLESNPYHQKNIGFSAEELKGKSLEALMGMGCTLDKDFRQALKLGESARCELTVQSKDTTTRFIDISAFPILDEQKEVHRFVGIGRDITGQKQAQEALAARLRFEEGLECCSRALLEETDTDEAMKKALHCLLEASLTSRVYVFSNFEDPHDGLCARLTHEVCAEGVRSYLDDPLSRQIPYKRGFERWRTKMSAGEAIEGVVKDFPRNERMLLKPQGISVEGQWFGFIGFEDCEKERTVTDEEIRLLRTASEIVGAYIESKKFEKALRVSEERFRSLVENAIDVIYSHTPDGMFSYLSPQFVKATGHEVSEFIGKPFWDLMHPDDSREVRQWFKQETHSTSLSAGEKQFRMLAKDGSWRWFVANESPIRDDNGEVFETIGVAHDITEMKNVIEDLKDANENLRRTQVQLVQSAKMASLGQLVAGIAHEINTPVGAMASMQDTLGRATARLKETLEDNNLSDREARTGVMKYLKAIEDANKVIECGSDRVTGIVKRLRSFARLDEAELKEVDIHEGLEDTLMLIHHEIKHDLTIKKDYGQLPRIACYPGRLNQVFLNLLNNARQALKSNGEISISTFHEDGKVYVRISDNGVGISPEDRKRVFDPGFTTKGVGVGTGLGLSICYQIIQDHRGEITVESELGKGTTFTISLPTNLEQIQGAKTSG